MKLCCTFNALVKRNALKKDLGFSFKKKKDYCVYLINKSYLVFLNLIN